MMLCCCINPAAASSAIESTRSSKAEIVWVERGNTLNHILFASFDGENWNPDATPLYSSTNPVTTPTIGSKRSGEKLLVWTEQKNNRALLFSIRGRSKTGDQRTTFWSKPTLFTDLRIENLAANILVDFYDRFWVFWSASGIKQSDVFFTREHVDDWTEPSRVNDENVVPDTQPLAHNDEAGDVVVEWSSFDRNSMQYISQSAIYSRDGKKHENQLDKEMETLDIQTVSEQNLTKIPLPNFLPENQRIFIHFPTNKLIQSILR